MAITVKDLIKELNKMPKNEKVGIAPHDYDDGVSDDVFSVTYISDVETDNKPTHRVVIHS